MALANAPDDETPLLLLLDPSNSRAGERWLARWEAGFAFNQRVPLSAWDAFVPGNWAYQLNLAIDAADRPVVLVTHGLACLAVAWWVEYRPAQVTANIRGAVFHDPPAPGRLPDRERPGSGERRAEPGTYPAIAMPFPACLLASRERGHAELNGLRKLARQWDCHFDTMAARAVSQPPAYKPVQSLGERFLAQVTSAKCAMRPASAQAGYPFQPKER